jgi:hypothetical protein
MCLRLIKNHYCPACVALAATNLGNSNFTANWTAVTGATGYYLDVSTDPAYGSFVPGYHNLYVGNVLTYDVTGLTPGVTYYYRMRTETVFCISIYSNSITQATPGAMLISSRGDGLGVAYLYIQVAAGCTLSLDGTARFYSDALGTLNESTTWTPTPGSMQVRYVRCPSGSANLMFNDITLFEKLGQPSSPSSGSPGWTYNTALPIANIPRLNCINWNFPNCVCVALNQSTISTFSFSLSQLSANFVSSYLYATGTITGSLADVPATCTILGLNNVSNLITGNVSDLPAGMLMLSIGTGNTITGDVADLPPGLTQISVAGSNTISGDVADLPVTLINFVVGGNNTISGDVVDLPATVTLISVQGSNTITGDINDLLNTVTYMNLGGSNTLSGDLANIPSGMTSCDVVGFNTLTGGFTGLSASMTRLAISGSNTINGDLADLPASIQQFYILGSNVINGTLASISAFANLSSFTCRGSNVISGAISDLPASLSLFDITGLNTVSGDLGDLPLNVQTITLTGNNTVADYTGKSWLKTTYCIYFIPIGVGGLSSAEVDQLLIDIDTDCTYTGIGNKTLYLMGTNAARTAASDAAVLSLQAKGVTVTTNP